jgi:hypothetical protein
MGATCGEKACTPPKDAGLPALWARTKLEKILQCCRMISAVAPRKLEILAQPNLKTKGKVRELPKSATLEAESVSI